MLTPNRFIELKHFFNPKVGVNRAKGQSADAVQAQIRKMIELELRLKPICDKCLSKMLADKGMSITRRTVSKYRELMNIPPVTQRNSVV